MSHWIAPLALLLVSLACAYHRAGLRTWTAACAAALLLCFVAFPAEWLWTSLATLAVAAIAAPLKNVIRKAA